MLSMHDTAWRVKEESSKEEGPQDAAAYAGADDHVKFERQRRSAHVVNERKEVGKNEDDDALDARHDVAGQRRIQQRRRAAKCGSLSRRPR